MGIVIDVGFRINGECNPTRHPPVSGNYRNCLRSSGPPDEIYFGIVLSSRTRLVTKQIGGFYLGFPITRCTLCTNS